MRNSECGMRNYRSRRFSGFLRFFIGNLKKWESGFLPLSFGLFKIPVFDFLQAFAFALHLCIAFYYCENGSAVCRCFYSLFALQSSEDYQLK